MITHMRRTQPASLYAPFSQVGYATSAFSFEFIMLRLHSVLSIQISVIYKEPSYWVNVGCWLSSALSYVKNCVDLVFTLYVEITFLTKSNLSSRIEPKACKKNCYHNSGANRLSDLSTSAVSGYN